MSSQISFYVLPDELLELESYINEHSGILILRTSIIPEVLIANSILEIPYLEGFIIPKFELTNVSIKQLKTNLYSINPITSPVIEFSQGIIKNNTLRATRLFLRKDFYNKEGESIKHSNEYILWCEGIFKWLKKKYKPCQELQYKGLRISPSVLNMLYINEIKLE